jgi:hypothetical protein
VARRGKDIAQESSSSRETCPDGSTWLSLPTALKLTAAGMIAGYLPDGVYRFAIATATAVYRSVAAVPMNS